MSDNLNPNDCRSTSAINAQEVFSPQQNLRPMNEYLTEVSDNAGDYCLIRCTLPAGAVVPMHSHADRETFYVVSGSINALRGDRWEELGPGDVFDVRDGAKHAWSNFVATGCFDHMRDNNKDGPVSAGDIEFSCRLFAGRASATLPQARPGKRVLAREPGGKLSGRIDCQLEWGGD